VTTPDPALTAVDPRLATLIAREERRRRTGLQLLAAESLATPAVRAVMASGLADKYAEGYPGRRYHGGCEVVDEVEELAIARARELFGAQYVNVQPLSWVLANLAVLAAFARPGDPILSLSLRHGGHQTHGSRANSSGRWFQVVNYGVRRDTEEIDYDELRDLALLHRPRVLVAGGTSYTRAWDLPRLRAIADEARCVLWVDAAHIAGLAVGGVLDSPVPYADVVTVATNKVIRGPRGGLLLSRAEYAEPLSRAVYPFLQGAPAMHMIGAKAVAFAEAATDEYRAYATDVAGTARALTGALAAHGLRPIGGGTDTHVGIVDVSSLGLTGRQAADRLAAAGIVVDKAVAPFDDQPVALGSAIRFGTAAAVAGGLAPESAARVADLMVTALRTPEDQPARHEAVAREVASLLPPVA